MEKSVLRIYLPISAKVKSERSFWQKIFGPSLGGFLLKKAKESGIEQALFQRVLGGYLNGQKLAFEQAEVNPPYYPQCLELVDSLEKLEEFLKENEAEVSGYRVLIFKAQELTGEKFC